jgi:hypothetical protein
VEARRKTPKPGVAPQAADTKVAAVRKRKTAASASAK